MSFTWTSALNITLLLLLVAAIVVGFLTLPVDKILKDLLVWIDNSLGPWGPLALIAVYIPLTVLAVPASVLTLGGGYLFGLPIGFIADSIGSTVGAVAAFLLGRTIGKSLVVSRLKDYPQFRSVTIAIQKSGFKPITLALVYVGTTLKDISDVTRGWGEFSKTHLPWIISGLVISVVLMIWVTKVAKSALDKALAECEDMDDSASSPELSIATEPSVDLNQPLINKTDQDEENQKM
ncbi:hypothetical protein PHAVU_003G092700 [Phaseolus vulgaris]|uniref:uncharacterized protein isoform X2 n=1 Tax=Phaseolus vulgaris TaxID=3885 RepID=UPI0035CA6ACE